ncbi:MAG: hypothetical protein KKE44_01430 [Proteobacteria bacterium]|nr:hypothetical protein [Pseudomonadota bacterium]MBU1581389.1 hypothetical protein [Pseudomonadota bacterium]MBU2456254.1 hypothetical protein [Pseudomonadota bacterium]MBU2628843.1 hypothetical protein [Pseudomonadota bacterium]
MNMIFGKVVVKETGKGVPDLLIVIYDLDFKTKPGKILSNIKNDTSSEIWQQVSGNRLGSILTDENGRFKLSYEDSQFQIHDKEKRPDIALFIAAPEDPGMELCSRILHISYDIRYNAGCIEQYIIRLPMERLKNAGISISGEPDVSLSLPGGEDLLAKMKILDQALEKEQKSDKLFSQRYIRQQSLFKKTLKKTTQPARPFQSVNLSIPAVFKKQESSLLEAMVSYDEKSGKFMLKKSKDSEPIPLIFKSITYAGDAKNSQSNPKGSGFIIDHKKKEIRLLLPPRSSNKLVHRESMPSDLFNWYSKQSRAEK